MALTGSVFGASAAYRAASKAPSGIVSRVGTQLYLNGSPYRFVGLNIYNANSRQNCWYSMGTGSDLADSLTAVNATGGRANAFRAWFFQDLATTGGQRDWTAFDHTLAVAQQYGFKVVVTLGNQWGDCDAGGYRTEGWYQGGYRTSPDPGMPSTYDQWVQQVVTRYKGNSAVLAWQLMNEAEDLVAGGGSCSATAEASLQAFAQDVGAKVKKIDPNHLLSLGTIGSGQCGSSGTDYQKLYSVSTLDLCEYHDYGAPTTPMPGDQWNGLAERLAQCAALNKPLFVGETGIQTADAGSLALRAADFEAKLTTQFGAGVAGELVWDWREAAYGGSSTTGYEVGPGDPVLPYLKTP